MTHVEIIYQRTSRVVWAGALINIPRIGEVITSHREGEALKLYEVTSIRHILGNKHSIVIYVKDTE